jgi:hypothetical protein
MVGFGINQFSDVLFDGMEIKFGHAPPRLIPRPTRLFDVCLDRVDYKHRKKVCQKKLGKDAH